MQSRQSNSLFKAISWVPNVVVLAILATIGYWGHHSHWKLPRFAQVVGADVGEGSAPGPGEGAIGRGAQARSAEGQPKAAAASQIPGRLPGIEFPSPEAARSCGVESGFAERRLMDDRVVANGVVDYDQTHFAQLSARAAGIVWRVEKRVGDVVERGDVLVIVDAGEVGRAKADLLEAAVMYKLKTNTLERLRAIQASVPARELREAEAAWELARVQRFNALQTLVNLGLPLRQEEITRLPTEDLADRLHFLGLPKSLVETLDPETTSANLIPLLAPFKGVVTFCDVVQGEMVEPSKPQYALADVTRMWINLDIRQEDAARLRLGADVIFNTEGETPPVASKLTWIGTQIDPRTRTIQARTDVDNPLVEEAAHDGAGRRLLHANAYGTAYISVRSSPQAVVVQSETVHWLWELGCYVVFVPADEGRRFEPRIVRVGLVRDGYTEITEGLHTGERVVNSGSRILLSELSQALQERLGDNAEAVRDFGITQPAPVASAGDK
ncbi:MAG: efflux RND transporter periplasmic adaptor subunit [Planctomycetaceae bacterium]